MTKLYHNGQREGWQIPGEQDKSAHRIDVPSSPAELASWLNLRRVGPTGSTLAQEKADEQLASAPHDARFWEVGPPTKEPPRVAPAFLGDLKSQAEFVPISKSAAIAASYDGCPKCHRTWTAQVLLGIGTASIDDLQLIAEAIKRHVGELRQGIEEGTRQ